MKKSTLIILALALGLGALVYYLEYKPGKPRDEEADQSREAFKLTREDIQQITLTRNGQNIVFENKENKWFITQPVNGLADDSAVNSLIGDLVSTRITRDIKATADEVKSYGLAEAKLKLEIKTKDGKSQRIEIGDKDFAGTNSYARVNGGADVAIISGSLPTSADKELKDLRDRSVLGGLTEYDLQGLRLNTESGLISLVKTGDDWKLTAPIASLAESSEINSLVTELTSAKAAEIVSDTADDLAKYGLNASKIGVTAQLKAGGERSLQIGNKDGEQYFAKSSDRPQIFKIEKAFYDKLNVKLAALRSKDLIKVTQDEVTRVELKNENGTLIVEPDKDHSKWFVVEPAAQKGKEATVFKLFTPLQSKAEEVLDKAPASAAAKLAKPVVVLSVTTKDGKTQTLRVSAADGESVYARLDGNNAVFKLGKMFLEGLNFKLETITSGS